MKNLFLALMLTAGTLSVNAQKIAYVDVNAVLESIPEYKTAQTQLDQVAEQWKQDIQAEYKKIEDMYRKFQAEEVLLSEQAKKQREDEIVNKEKAVRDMQKSKFGMDGELSKKRQTLVKPIQERVFKAIQNYATEKGYDFIFDKANSSMLFANEMHDKTQDIIKKLGN